MTAEHARTETSGKHKPARSTSSRASAATLAAQSEDIAEHEESAAAQSADIAEHEEPITPQPENVAEHVASVAEPAPSVVAQPESAAQQVKTDATSAEAGVPEPKANVASPKENVAPSEPDADKPRFRIFVVDSGWNHCAHKVLLENIDIIHALTHEDPIYVLDADKSIALLRRNKALIGHDPIISVHDLYATGKRGPGDVHGFRLHLGLLHNEKQALSALKMFARFLSTHRDAKDLDAEVRHKLNGDGLAGAIEIVGGAAHGALTEA